jgi:hypothetical protein
MTVALHPARYALVKRGRFLTFPLQPGNHLHDSSYQEKLSEDEKVTDNKP